VMGLFVCKTGFVLRSRVIVLRLSELTLVLSKNARPEPKLIRVRGIRTIVKLWINIQRTQERGGAREVKVRYLEIEKTFLKVKN
jgi:hypothetical protein